LYFEKSDRLASSFRACAAGASKVNPEPEEGVLVFGGLDAKLPLLLLPPE
jgi:hypothetical protein